MKDNKKKIMISISLIVVFVVALAGISYAAFTYVGKGDIINQITTAEISMDYKESDNVISLNNALPTTDETGKVRLNEGEYFDFSVTTKIAGNTMINWEIAAEDFDDNTFDGANVKYYLTKIVDGNEIPVSEDLPAVYHEETIINKYTGRPANQMSLLVGTSSTIGVETTNYRLRLYVDEKYNPQGDGGGLIYKTRINVYGSNTTYHKIQTDEGVIIDQDATTGDTVHFEVEDRPGYIYDGAEILNKDGEVIEIVPNDKKGFVMPDEEITIKIKWKGETHTIDTSNSGEVPGGSISVSDSAEYGSTVTITPNPEVGYQYDGVAITDQEGNTLLTLGSDETSFEMPLADINIIPSFSKINYTITVNKITGGQITLEKSTGTIGDVIKFTTIENEGYGYNGATVRYEDKVIEIESTKKEFVMPASNITITPSWSKVTYTITKATATGGSITLGKTSGTVGDKITFTTTEDTGYQYNGVTVSYEGKTLEIESTKKEFVMPASNVAVTPKFIKINYTITKSSATGGSISIGSTSTYQATVTFTTTEDTGYQYNGATVTYGSNTINVEATKKEFMMPASNVTITPKFTKINYTITNSAVTGGTITIAANSTYNASVSFTTSPSTGYAYNGAIVKNAQGTTIATLTSSQKSFTMPASNVTIIPKWTPLNYNITNTSVEGGKIVIAATSAYNATVSFETNANIGYQYNGATVRNALGAVIATLSATEKSFTMPSGDVTITGDFKKIVYSISKEEVTGGTITIDNSATYGATVSFTPNANSGYGYTGAIVKNSSGEGIATLSPAQTSFVMPASNVVVIPSFRPLSVIKDYTTVKNGNFDFYRTGDFYDYKIQVTSIVIKNNIAIPSTAVHMDNMDSDKNYWDVSTAGDRSVIAYFEEDGTTKDSYNATVTAYKLTIGGNGGVKAPTNSHALFGQFYNVTSMDLTYLNTSDVTNMGQMFNNCPKLLELDLRNFDTSNVTDMHEMFEYCTNLGRILVGSKWTMAKVTSSYDMYIGCACSSSGVTHV